MSRKYIIEFEEIPSEQTEIFVKEDRFVSLHADERLFRAVGLQTLLLDQKKLEKLTPLPEDYENSKKREKAAYEKGLEEGWNYHRRMSGMSLEELESCFAGESLSEKDIPGLVKKMKAMEQKKRREDKKHGK